MRKILGCFIIIMIMITSQIFAGAVYYVDATNGSDSNSGTSQGIAWKTINKVNNSSFYPGDSILFKRGEIWREQLTIPSSGSIGNPITFGAFGSGDNPIINGADLVRGWIRLSGYNNVWQATQSTETKSVYFDETRGTKETSITNLNVANEWYWVSNALYVYSESDPDTAYTNPGIEVVTETRKDGVVLTNRDYITIDGLHITKVLRWGVNGHQTATDGIDYITIQNCTINFIGPGMTVEDPCCIMPSRYDDYWTISDNILHDTFRVTLSGAGIYCGNPYEGGCFPVTNFMISGNTIYNVSTGIKLCYGSVDNTVQNNIVHDCSSYGIRSTTDTSGTRNTIRYNKVYNVSGDGDTGIEIFNYSTVAYNIIHDCYNGIFVMGPTVDTENNMDSGDNNDIYNNVIYNNVINLALWNADGTTCENNNIKNNILSEGTWAVQYEIDPGEGLDNNNINYNCYYDSGTINFRVGSTNKTFAQWASWIKDDVNSMNFDPLMTNATKEFNLQSFSPCINSGTDVSLTQDYDGNTVPNGWAVDIGAYEYQGSGSPPLSAETNASPSSGYVPLAVSFTGSASGGTAPYTYSWDFGDGSSSSDQNPSHTYSSAGTYTVTITVTDSSSSQATDSLIITATSPTSALSASGSASPTSGQVPLAVSFTASASGGTAPYSYSWNFGDGQSSSSQNPAHTYSSAGTYSITLTVTDSTSSQASASIAITAQTQISALAASCTASPISGDIPLTVNFTGTAAGGISPYAYSWNFGDGASSTAQNPSHTYTQAGTYTITLTVTDSASSQATASTEVSASAPVHEVTVPDTPEGPSTGAPGVSYTYTTGGASCSQGHSVEYYFDWGDGTYSSWSSSTSASHIWSTAGTYAVKVQARCSVNPGVTSLWSEAKTVSLEESPNFQLYISSATDSPASGQGGSTNPDTGSYPYPAGNTAQVTALPAANYRFSKWTGDISGSDSYNSEITFNMDQDKSISALFCTQCGDVNGDLSITPADAQDAFEMFLGIISNATETQKENADVNCDGTATEPNITPADAQAIFEKFLGISELPGDCSCRSRADASSTAFTQNNRSQTAPLEIQSGTPNIQLTIDDIDARFKREITVPVHISNPFNIKSFGFDLIFDSGTLEFAGIEIGSLLNGFTMVDANEISEGVVRVGGFSSEPILTSSPGVLVRLKFRVLGRAKEPSPLSITNTVDDIKNAVTSSGAVFYKEINDKIMRNKNVL